MKLRINGEEQAVGEQLSVAALLAELDMEAPRGVAVAVNDAVVPRSTWDDVRLQEGDAVEIIRATQGG